jgi:hypothetical protein
MFRYLVARLVNGLREEQRFLRACRDAWREAHAPPRWQPGCASNAEIDEMPDR